MNLISAEILRWTARILSVASLLLLLAFATGEDGLKPSRVAPQEWIGLAFFPFGVAVGMLIGWWNEKLGGLISITSLAGFYLIYGGLVRGSLAMGWYFALFTLPGFLFLLSGLMKGALNKPLHH
jgi:hypothetical protein